LELIVNGRQTTLQGECRRRLKRMAGISLMRLDHGLRLRAGISPLVELLAREVDAGDHQPGEFLGQSGYPQDPREVGPQVCRSPGRNHLVAILVGAPSLGGKPVGNNRFYGANDPRRNTGLSLGY
jgi:hypothetical protein